MESIQSLDYEARHAVEAELRGGEMACGVLRPAKVRLLLEVLPIAMALTAFACWAFWELFFPQGFAAAFTWSDEGLHLPLVTWVLLGVFLAIGALVYFLMRLENNRYYAVTTRRVLMFRRRVVRSYWLHRRLIKTVSGSREGKGSIIFVESESKGKGQTPAEGIMKVVQARALAIKLREFIDLVEEQSRKGEVDALAYEEEAMLRRAEEDWKALPLAEREQIAARMPQGDEVRGLLLANHRAITLKAKWFVLGCALFFVATMAVIYVLAEADREFLCIFGAGLLSAFIVPIVLVGVLIPVYKRSRIAGSRYLLTRQALVALRPSIVGAPFIVRAPLGLGMLMRVEHRADGRGDFILRRHPSSKVEEGFFCLDNSRAWERILYAEACKAQREA